MAILLAAFLLVGITPGPRLLTEHTELAFTLLWTLAISNVLVSLICLALGAYIIKLTTISFVYLVPVILALVIVGIYLVSIP